MARRTTSTLVAGTLGALMTLTTLGVAADQAGAVVRPDYAGLGDEAPDITRVELNQNGTALVELTVPDGATPRTWHVVTFHVPNVADWHTGQVLADGGPVVLGPGAHTFTLRIAPGHCQVDVYLDGEEEPYAADTSLARGWDTCNTTPLPDFPPVADVPAQAAPAPGTGGDESALNPAGSATLPPLPLEVVPLPAAGGSAIYTARIVRSVSLPATGATTGRLALFAAGLLAAGGVAVRTSKQLTGRHV